MPRATPLHTALLLLALAWQPVPGRADVVVVVHRDSPLRDLTVTQLSELYLGRTRALPGGEAIVVVDRERDSLLRARFFRLINGMSLKQVNAYWARLQFSGQVLPPPSFGDTKELLAAIRANRHAVAYIDETDLTESVRVVLRLKESA